LHGLAILNGIDILFLGTEPVKTARSGYEFRQFLHRDIVGEELGLLYVPTDNDKRRKGFHFRPFLRRHHFK
jgi:hypothetical protein